jgi:hypothetical protein
VADKPSEQAANFSTSLYYDVHFTGLSIHNKNQIRCKIVLNNKDFINCKPWFAVGYRIVIRIYQAPCPTTNKCPWTCNSTFCKIVHAQHMLLWSSRWRGVGRWDEEVPFWVFRTMAFGQLVWKR